MCIHKLFVDSHLACTIFCFNCKGWTFYGNIFWLIGHPESTAVLTFTMCYWSMKFHDIYYICRSKTSFSKSWTCSDMRRGYWVPTFRCNFFLLHPSCKHSQGAGWKRHRHGSVNPLLQIQDIPAYHVLCLSDKSTSQFPKSHVFSLGICKPVACILMHVPLSCWQGRRIKSLAGRLCATSTLWEAEEKMLPVMNSAQIQRISSQRCTHY